MQAVERLTTEIKWNPYSLELFLLRAQNLLKLEKFKEAASDAARAIEFGSGAEAHMAHGKALFNLGQYVESLDTFKKGKEKGGSYSEKLDQFGQWIAWCEERIKKLGLSDPPPEIVQNKAESTMANAENTATSGQDPNTMPVPKIKHDWYQTDTHIVITILIKNMKKEDVKLDTTETTVSVSAPLPGGSEYSLELDLGHPIKPSESSFKVYSSKIEVKLKKVDCIRWVALEGDATAPVPKAVPGATSSEAAKVPSYPTSSSKKHDWDKIEAQLKAEEEDEKLEGDAALNKLFQKIYGQGSEETRRAMNKSFMESGGTVLSTNWNEVGEQKVEVKPPDGVEYRKWN
ncbi:protein SGT1 homolog isoform X2 [Penaeus chinensis]|nr:protein SGT1 homolog isoform X2 [Penaeus chinensis]